MKNISELHDCYGCGVCVRVCPVRIISLRENADGFYVPVIDEQEKCIECGLCLKVCAFNHDEVASPVDAIGPECYAAWSNDPATRRRCSSGGVGYELGRSLLDNGYRAVGVKYDPSRGRAMHFVAATPEEFAASMGSKYIPSDTTEALGDISFKDKYLFTGTPCQIDSMRRLIRHFRCEDRFVLLDFFCHGVPSLLMWDKYIRKVEEQTGRPSSVAWRDKTTGWQDSWSMTVTADGVEPAYTSRFSQGDTFYRMFLGNYCLDRCCYATCKYKMLSSAADIRIGDLWGDKYSSESAGVSGLICLTRRGSEVVGSLGDSVTLRPEDVATVTSGQMHRNAVMPAIYDKVMAQLKTAVPLSSILDGTIRVYNLRFIHLRLLNRLRRLFHLKPINFNR